MEEEKETNKQKLTLATNELVTDMLTHKEYTTYAKEQMRTREQCALEEQQFIIVDLEEIEKEKLA